MAQFDNFPRVGRSQGATIFWGLVSVCFAAAACYYFWKNHENEASANKLRDEVLTLQDQRDSLSSEKDKLQSGISETEKQLKTREDFLKEKEADLAAEENRIEALGKQTQNQSQQNQNQAAAIKKFDDTVRQIAKGDDTDVLVRGGRPVLRVPNSVFFALGDATLKPEGKAMLDQIVKSLGSQADNFELRIECYTDSDAEIQKGDSAPADKDKPSNEEKPAGPPKPNAPAPSHYATSWELTAARAGALAHYLHESDSIPFQNVIATGRGDYQPIVANAKEGHARNRRIEITIAPTPTPFHAPDLAHAGANSNSSEPVNPLEPPPDPPHPAAKGN